ncbi:hypothetical protein Taro_024655 [Colocasia esculenta]|uniref:Uncharacterized protein n=1 Tax=Colocasia esculenta TaxID=4460 RepID=A0A843V9Z9_COLES|nr:hypothetical protein [Colocasia esculenta]
MDKEVASRLKKHLAGGRLTRYHDVQSCKLVPFEVKRLMVDHLKGVRAETARKKADREMQERIISRRQRDEDDNDEPEFYAEHLPDEHQRWIRLIRAQSRVESWEAEQRGSFEVGSDSVSGSGSRVGDEVQRLDNLVYVHYNMRLRVKHLTKDPKHGEVEYDPVEIGLLRDDEDPMVTKRGDYELDEEADDPKDPPRPNTFLARAIEAEEEKKGEHGNVRQPHSSQFQAELEDEV